MPDACAGFIGGNRAKYPDGCNCGAVRTTLSCTPLSLPNSSNPWARSTARQQMPAARLSHPLPAAAATAAAAAAFCCAQCRALSLTPASELPPYLQTGGRWRTPPPPPTRPCEEYCTAPLLHQADDGRKVGVVRLVLCQSPRFSHSSQCRLSRHPLNSSSLSTD
jgi:hypothetical protein